MGASRSVKPGASSRGRAPEVKFDGATPDYRRALVWVIAINLLGFVVVLLGGPIWKSASLFANAFDYLADSAIYAISLWAIGRPIDVRTKAALVKGGSLGAAALFVLAFAAWRASTSAAPSGEAISFLGLFGAVANVIAAAFLVPYRDGDANVRSVWLCTRNDLLQCLAVAVTGVLVWATGSRWPDLIVSVLLAGVFLNAAYQIICQARAEHRAALA